MIARLERRIFMSISIVHLSDIHIKTKDDIIHGRINKIARACTSVIPAKSDVILAISGDIAFSGKEDQYQLATKDINDLVDFISKEKAATIHYFLTPGNHDCDFSINNSIRETLVSNVRSNIDVQYYNSVSDVQTNYFSFAKKFDCNSKDMVSTSEIQSSEGKILLISINTAWMSVLNEVPGKIIMPPSLFKSINTDKYKLIITELHHPTAWLNPDHKTEFITYLRQNSDILLMGHEHLKDYYETSGQGFNILCNHGKELQDSNSDESAFSIINFNQNLYDYDLFDISWNGSCYKISNSQTKTFHKNSATQESMLYPNSKAIATASDIGISVKHFAKEDVTLPDLYVWPELNKSIYSNNNKKTLKIQKEVYSELSNNKISIVIGPATSGKSSLAKMLFLTYAQENYCCLYIKGSSFTSTDRKQIAQVITQAFEDEYSESKHDEFLQLSSNDRAIIVDDFDSMSLHGERRNCIISYLTEYFGNIILLLSSEIEFPSLISCSALSTFSEVISYEILPFGNRKRKELISKWYHLQENSRDEEEIEDRIESSINVVDTFLGNGAYFIPAIPIAIIAVLQNGDSIAPSYNGSQYGFLYETMIQRNLSTIGVDYAASGSYNIDINVVSHLAFFMLKHRKTYFIKDELCTIVKEFNSVKKLSVSCEDILNKMCTAKIFFQDTSEGITYRFKYLYIFYYFSGHYLAYHPNDNDVKDIVNYMSSRLYIEDYANIIIFLCHFANNTDVIESILLNACITLENYQPFDFSKSNTIFSDIQSLIDAMIPKSIGGDEDVSINRDRSLSELDDAGINDGHVEQNKSLIIDEVNDKEKDLAAISASFKTLEVLGEILQNYPGEISGNLKIEMINELHNLGMRSIQAIIQTTLFLEQDVIDFIIDRATSDDKNYRREDIVTTVKSIINLMLSEMVQAIIHMIANSLNSKYLLPVSKEALEKDPSLSSKLVLADLKINCLKSINYQDISALKDQLDGSNQYFASSILKSIVAHYLNFNRCDYKLRSKLCDLFNFSLKQTMLKTTKSFIEQGY